jgi:hypothetical protein
MAGKRTLFKGFVMLVVISLLVLGLSFGTRAQVPAPGDASAKNEIMRGAKAASGCYDDYPPDLILKEKTDCIEKVKKDHAAVGAPSEPFLFGLYVKAWSLMHKEVKDMEGMYKMMDRGAEHEVARKRVSSYLSSARKMDTRRKIDEKTLCEILKSGCEDLIRELGKSKN